MISETELQRLRAETPGVGKNVHLLASGSALMPQPVLDAVVNHTMLEAELGGYEAAAQEGAALEAVYGQTARHIGAKPHEIALMENATVAWCHAFYALPLKPKTRILTCEAEYAANYVAILQRAKRDDLTIEVVPSDASGALDIAALEATIDTDVSLIAMTWVPTNGGLINPAAEVGRVARAHGVPYLLDGCQALGQMKIDVSDLGCDFFSATGRKFLRGPRGTGFLYVRENWLETLEPAMIDHFGAPWVARDTYQLRPDARRFETWENAYALRMGLGAAFDYADAIGIERIAAQVSHLAEFARGLLADNPQITVRDLGAQRCGIVSFSIEKVDLPGIVAGMRDAGFTIGMTDPPSTRIDAERRGLSDMLRMAPHYYNSEAEIARAIQTLGKLLKRA